MSIGRIGANQGIDHGFESAPVAHVGLGGLQEGDRRVGGEQPLHVTDLAQILGRFGGAVRRGHAIDPRSRDLLTFCAAHPVVA